MSQLKIAEYIIKAGRAAAQTKYGKMAVEKVEKLYNDYIKKLNKGQEKTKDASQGQASVKRTNLKRLGQGAVGGALLNEVFGGRGDGKAEVKERKASGPKSNIPSINKDDKPTQSPPKSVAEAKRRGMDYYIGADGKKKKAVYAEEVKPKAKPKPKAPAQKKKSNVLSETDASTAISYNRGGMGTKKYANCGASMKPNRMSRS